MRRDCAGARKNGKGQSGIVKLRPNVVLNGEGNPKGEMIGELAEQDLGLGPELIFVVKIALKVPGAWRLMTELYHARKTQSGLP